MLHEHTVALLALLVCSNGAPILVRKLLGKFGDFPVDGGWVTTDQRRLLGPSKTIRGIAAAVLTGAIVSMLLGLGAGFGALFVLIAMLGDLLSSFVKRRMGLDSSASALGLDQIPESLLPLLFAKVVFDLDWLQVGVTVLMFIVLEIVLSPVLYYLKIRVKP